MPRATRREIEKSTYEVPEQGSKQSRRQGERVGVGYTTNSPKQPPAMFSRKKADDRDKFWRALGKQISQGASVRVNVR